MGQPQEKCVHWAHLRVDLDEHVLGGVYIQRLHSQEPTTCAKVLNTYQAHSLQQGSRQNATGNCAGQQVVLHVQCALHRGNQEFLSHLEPA